MKFDNLFQNVVTQIYTYLEDKMPNLHSLENALPVAPLKLVVMDSAQKMGEEINSYLVEFRKNINNKFSKEIGSTRLNSSHR